MLANVEAPLSWQLDSDDDPKPEGVREFRDEVRGRLNDWDLAFLRMSAELIVSELVTNAVRARAHKVRVCLYADKSVLRIDVYDDAPGIVIMRSPRAGAQKGRGLQIVRELAASWGVEYFGDHKRVFANLTMGG